jgi:hypothetical protein
MPEQEFAQPMARSKLVLLRRLSRADEIAERFMRASGTHTGVKSPAR